MKKAWYITGIPLYQAFFMPYGVIDVYNKYIRMQKAWKKLIFQHEKYKGKPGHNS